jgi:hypothetical protein
VQLRLPLKIANTSFIVAPIFRRRQELKPDRIQLQSPQSEHPLQGHGKISSTFAILRRKTASEKNCHASRFARVRNLTSLGMSSLAKTFVAIGNLCKVSLGQSIRRV